MCIGQVFGQNAKRLARSWTQRTLVDLFKPFGIEPEFLGHLDEFLRGLGILDGAGQSLGSEGLVAVVIGLGHVSTFLDRYQLRQKGSFTTMRTADRVRSSKIRLTRRAAASRLADEFSIGQRL